MKKLLVVLLVCTIGGACKLDTPKADAPKPDPQDELLAGPPAEKIAVKIPTGFIDGTNQRVSDRYSNASIYYVILSSREAGQELIDKLKPELKKYLGYREELCIGVFEDIYIEDTGVVVWDDGYNQLGQFVCFGVDFSKEWFVLEPVNQGGLNKKALVLLLIALMGCPSSHTTDKAKKTGGTRSRRVFQTTLLCFCLPAAADFSHTGLT